MAGISNFYCIIGKFGNSKKSSSIILFIVHQDQEINLNGDFLFFNQIINLCVKAI